ncbi:MAG: hypothetical protein AAB784_01830 [Patescibacteria group bacterium]
MQKIRYKNQTIGILVRAISRGSLPQTAVKEPLQLITIKHSKGKHLVAHTNPPVVLNNHSVQEGLVMRKGKIRMNLYGPDEKLFKKIILKPGDAFILQKGGHSFDFLEDSEFIEIKNGPKIWKTKILIEE